MKKNLFLFSVIFLITLISLVSAGLCRSDSGYYVDCYDSYDSYDSYSYSGHAYNDVRYAYYLQQYPAVERAPKPIFKGSYGNYRYQQYLYGHNPYAYSLSGFYAYPRYGGFYGYGYGPAFGYGYFW